MADLEWDGGDYAYIRFLDLPFDTNLDVESDCGAIAAVADVAADSSLIGLEFDGASELLPPRQSGPLRELSDPATSTTQILIDDSDVVETFSGKVDGLENLKLEFGFARKKLVRITLRLGA
jgi:hypothetical protein